MLMFAFNEEELNEEHDQCGSCGTFPGIMYAMNDTKDAALKEVLAGDAGLCAECMCELLVEAEFEIGEVGGEGEPCPDCGSTGTHEIMCAESSPHYASSHCSTCSRWLRWLPKPRGKVYAGGESKG